MWETTVELTTKHSLVKLYENSFPGFQADKVYLADFFNVILGISDCSWMDIIGEIKALKSSDFVDFDRICLLYSCLHRIRLIAISARELK